MRSLMSRISLHSVFGFAAFLLLAPSFVIAQGKGDATTRIAEIPTYRVGGMSIAIPVPASDLIEMGQDYRVIMEVSVPEQNRLVAAFVLPDDLAVIKSGGKYRLSKYALIEVSRSVEFTNFSTKDFKDFSDSANRELGNVLTSSTKEIEEEVNRRVKALNLDDKVSFDKPISLGCFFSKQDAFASGMLLSVTMQGVTKNMINVSAILRVRNRAIFVYIYAVYEDQDSLKWVQKTTEDWADAILKANEQ